MKNEFVGDVADFAKYGLLKFLSGEHGPDPERLGVLWYLTPDGGRFGKHLAYLEPPKSSVFQPLDRTLHEKLGGIVSDGARDVEQIEKRAVLPRGTSFFRDNVSLRDRDAWFASAKRSLEDRSLVFLDPDNGLATVPTHEQAAESEAEALLARGQSVISIQFPHRTRTHDDQLRGWAERSTLWSRGPSTRPFAIRWRSIASFGFIVMPASDRHADVLRARADAMLALGWSRVFGDVLEARLRAEVGPSTANSFATPGPGGRGSGTPADT